jgi:regulator of protease activity HflC (stomatin/prohibitin superfamily)
MVRVDLRTVVLDVPTQDVITRDNVSVKVNAVVYFRVVDPQRAIIQVANFLEATSQLAQTTLRSVLGKHELDELLASANSSTSTSRPCSIRRPTPGASRSRSWRSSTST